MKTYEHEITTEMANRLDSVFAYHPPKSDQVDKYELIRSNFLEFARGLVALTPSSREQSLMLTKLEEASMFANAAIARNE